MSSTDIIQLVEALQLDSEKKLMQGYSQSETVAQHESLRKFYNSLKDPELPNLDRGLLAQSVKDLMFGELNEDQVTDLQRVLERLPIRFTTIEPPGVALTIAKSFSRVWRFVRSDLPIANFTLATDLTYRPHASVQEWVGDQYLILMGRYLLADLHKFAILLAELIADIWQDTDEAPWANDNFHDELLDGLEKSKYRWQFGYLLCSFAEGERYRFALMSENSDFANQITNQLYAGAIDFLIAHELTHVLNGDLRKAPESTEQLPLPALFKSARQILPSLLGKDAEQCINLYEKHYWIHHQREVLADGFGLICAAGDGPQGALDLRLMGAQMAICTISFLDRVAFLMQHQADPASLLGLDNYMQPGLMDFIFPKPSHPWGKTRASLLNSSFPMLYKDFFSREELHRKAKLMHVIQEIMGVCGAHALLAIKFVNSKPGEFLALINPETNQLWTRCFSSSTSTREGDGDIFTDPSKFYADAPGIDLASTLHIHPLSRVKNF